MNVTLQLLNLMTFDHLTSLEIKYVGASGSNLNKRKEITNALVTASHNAPSLERIVLSKAAIKIQGVEMLHAGATKLKHLGFRDIIIYSSGQDEVETLHGPAENLNPTQGLETFSLDACMSFRTTSEERLARDDEIEKWITYIGIKHPYLQKLCV